MCIKCLKCLNSKICEGKKIRNQSLDLALIIFHILIPSVLPVFVYLSSNTLLWCNIYKSLEINSVFIFILLHFIFYEENCELCFYLGKKIQNTNPRCLWPKLLQLRPLATQSGGAVTPQWSCSVHLGPFRSVSLKQGLAGGNSWHRFMEAVGEKGRGRRTGVVMASFFPPPSPTLWTEPPGSVVAKGTDWRHFSGAVG